ncbi:hypothetical protein [Paenibacillus abyssi]|uniref:Uncharacterized protein n=1 Tax=Paenibacillus abyssi TaxID=1340531 RepID=A0A917G4X4_9BACL|nr:hypothetical protein [Paenibacillus abyssi]GGG23281.1 hypothetical protein GCM10010916_44840 [Paenibacillus abyssi]
MGVLYEIISRTIEQGIVEELKHEHASVTETGRVAETNVEAIIRKCHQEAERKLKAYYAEENGVNRESLYRVKREKDSL